jgi:hypothetical protein
MAAVIPEIGLWAYASDMPVHGEQTQRLRRCCCTQGRFGYLSVGVMTLHALCRELLNYLYTDLQRSRLQIHINKVLELSW